MIKLGCIKGLKHIILYISPLLLFLFLSFNPKPIEGRDIEKGLKDYYSKNFLIGAAIFPALFDNPVSAELIKTHFNSITPENEMKWGSIHPTPGQYRFERADKIAEFAQANNIKLIGHTLVWHSQLGQGVFTKEDSTDLRALVDKDTLYKRIKEHIFTVAGRYKGKVHGWDVVNEALNEDGTMRESGFYKIAGDEFIEKAFEYAHIADPDAELYYNDYNLVIPEKRAGAVSIVKRLKEKGLRIDAVGVQGHWDLKFPELIEIENTIRDFSELGVKVMFTELDVSVLPSPWRNSPSADISIRHENSQEMNPYKDGLPESVADELAKRYGDIFTIFNKHKGKISRVTFWGLHDGISWKNNFPVPGRTDYPLLFDREMKPKKAYLSVIDLMNK
jgi:endo-1,4-beta-xylanase|uniref:1,4-beta-xylanase n=1 Tax=uncultured microorganism TaxID=358574 RepID=A0A7U1GK30_9ZZZZ|nr:1,4-beta-xylanase [uncultured microorganism]